MHPFSDAPADSAAQWIELSEQISMCSRRLRSRIAAHSSAVHLGDAQLSLLWACLKTPPEGTDQTALARSLAISPAHVSGQVEHLRRQGLLSSQRSIHDRRRQQWRLTPSGHEAIQTLLTHLEEWGGQLGRHLDPRQLLALLDLLTAALSDDPCAAGGSMQIPLSHAPGSITPAPAQQRGAA